MQLTIHLTFAGTCEQAFRFYERLLGGTTLALFRYGDTPAAADVPPDFRDKVVHATLTIGNYQLAGADVEPARYERPTGFYKAYFQKGSLFIEEKTELLPRHHKGSGMPRQRLFSHIPFNSSSEISDPRTGTTVRVRVSARAQPSSASSRARFEASRRDSLRAIGNQRSHQNWPVTPSTSGAQTGEPTVSHGPSRHWLGRRRRYQHEVARQAVSSGGDPDPRNAASRLASAARGIR